VLLSLRRQSGCFAIRQLSISVSCSNVEPHCFSQHRAAAPPNKRLKLTGHSSPLSAVVPLGNETRRFQPAGHRGRQLSREPLGGSRNMMRNSLLLAAFAFLACNVTYSEQSSLEVPGEIPGDRLVLAQTIASAVASSDYKSRIQERFPQVSPEQLAGLQIRWNRMAGTQFKDGSTEPFDIISVQCKITLKQSDPTSKEILEFCKSLLQAELDRQLGKAAA